MQDTFSLQANTRYSFSFLIFLHHCYVRVTWFKSLAIFQILQALLCKYLLNHYGISPDGNLPGRLATKMSLSQTLVAYRYSPINRSWRDHDKMSKTRPSSVQKISVAFWISLMKRKTYPICSIWSIILLSVVVLNTLAAHVHSVAKVPGIAINNASAPMCFLNPGPFPREGLLT